MSFVDNGVPVVSIPPVRGLGGRSSLGLGGVAEAGNLTGRPPMSSVWSAPPSRWPYRGTPYDPATWRQVTSRLEALRPASGGRPAWRRGGGMMGPRPTRFGGLAFSPGGSQSGVLPQAAPAPLPPYRWAPGLQGLGEMTPTQLQDKSVRLSVAQTKLWADPTNPALQQAVAYHAGELARAQDQYAVEDAERAEALAAKRAAFAETYAGPPPAHRAAPPASPSSLAAQAAAALDTAESYLTGLRGKALRVAEKFGTYVGYVGFSSGASQNIAARYLNEARELIARLPSGAQQSALDARYRALLDAATAVARSEASTAGAIANAAKTGEDIGRPFAFFGGGKQGEEPAGCEGFAWLTSPLACLCKKNMPTSLFDCNTGSLKPLGWGLVGVATLVVLSPYLSPVLKRL